MIKTTNEDVHPSKSPDKPVYILQSLMAGAYIFFVFWAMNSFQSQLAVTSLGASAFIAFTFPEDHASRPRLLLGGYCVGVASGLLCGLLILPCSFLFSPSYIPVCAIAMFLSMLLMTALNLKHPPSAALAVSIVTDPNPVALAFAAMACIVILCILKKVLKKHLHNLQK